MRKRLAVFLFIAALMLTAVTAYAELPQPIDTAISSLPDGGRQIVYTYQFALDADQSGKIPQSFEDDGYNYICAGTVTTEIVTEDVREATIEKSMTSASRIRATGFAETIDYDADGYIGILTRDNGTFTVAGTGTKNVSKTVTETKKYSGLSRNDMSLIDKTYKGLNLTSVDWYDQNTGQSVRGFTDGLPGPYYAVANYKGMQTSKVTTGYAAKVMYKGSVSKRITTGTEITVTYTGNPIPKKSFPYHIPIAIASGVILLGGLCLWLFNKNKRGAGR